MEDEVGHELFRRNRRYPAEGLLLTRAGEVLLSEARLILGAVERAERRIERLDPTGASERIAIGFTSATPGELVSAVIGIHHLMDSVEVLPLHLTWGEESPSLHNGRVDLAFMQYPAGSESTQFVRRTLVHCNRVLVAPADHPVGRLRRPLTLDDIAEEALLDPGFADVPEMYRDYWLAEPRPHRGPGPFVRPWKALTVEQMCAYVAAGRGLAVASETVSRQFSRPDVVFLPVEDLPPVAIGICRLRNERRPAVIDVFEAVSTPEIVDWAPPVAA